VKKGREKRIVPKRGDIKKAEKFNIIKKVSQRFELVESEVKLISAYYLLLWLCSLLIIMNFLFSLSHA
jgi:hypothetical protein